MSRYLTWGHKRRFADREMLVTALTACGFTRGQIEVSDTPVALVGYDGGQRAESAEVVIRRRHVGAVSNDIGFRKSAVDGCYEPIISEFDAGGETGDGHYGDAWQGTLMAAYSTEVVRAVAREVGGELIQEQVVDDSGALVNRYVLAYGG